MCMGWEIGHTYLVVFVFVIVVIVVSMLLSMLLSLLLLYTTQELLPRCEANQAGGEDQLVGVGRCQRDRFEQGAGGGRVIVMILVTMVMVMMKMVMWSGQMSE